jgi:hypothetical protein
MRRTPLLHATTALLLASCNPLTQSCTLIGCSDGLNVRFSTALAGPYTVEAWSELRVAPQVFECRAGEPCDGAFFPDFEGNDVMVRVTTAAGVRTQEFTGVDYEPQYPNGRRCGAVCQQAEVTVQL